MKNTIVHHEGAASLEVAVNKIKLSGSVIKIGLDVHARLYVAVAQYDQLLPKPARRLAPSEFVPWVEQLLRAGHTVHVVYEACGFGFGLYRELKALGAHCYVIAPRKLDEQCTRVKTDPRDATTLCQRLSRYVEGNTRELAVIRVPTEAEEQARHVSRQREQLVRHRQKLEAQGRSLLVNHSLPAPAHWWKNQTWSRLSKLLPGLDLSSPGSSPAGLVDTGATDQRFECGVGSGRSSRCSRRRGQTNYRGDDPRDLFVGALYQPARHQFVHRTVSGRTQQRQQTGTRQRDQTRQPAVARGAGGMCLAHGALPTAVSAGEKTLERSGQRRARHRRTTQKSHRGRGPTSGGRSVAHAHRSLQRPPTRPSCLSL